MTSSRSTDVQRLHQILKRTSTSVKRRWKSLPPRVYIGNQLAHRRTMSSEPVRTRSIYVDVPDNRFERHLYNFLVAFQLCEYRIRLRHRWNLFSRSGAHPFDHGRFLFELPNIEVTFSHPSTEDFVFHMKDEHHYGVRLDERLFTRSRSNQSIVYPIGVHPKIHAFNLHHTLDDLAKRTARPFKVVFAGGAKDEDYSRHPMRELFGKVPRHEVIRALRTGLEPKHIAIPKSQSDLQRLGSGRYFCLVLKENFELPRPLYIEFLSSSHFFVCPPGFATPLCHNAVESMACATVPILEYPEFFDPPLEDGRNCLVYRGSEGALAAVRRALNLSSDESARMRIAARRYYEDNLSPKALVRRIEAHGDVERIYLNANVQSARALAAEQQSSNPTQSSVCRERVT